MHIQILLYPQPCSNSLKVIRISVNNKQYITVNICCQLLYTVYLKIYLLFQPYTFKLIF